VKTDFALPLPKALLIDSTTVPMTHREPLAMRRSLIVQSSQGGPIAKSWKRRPVLSFAIRCGLWVIPSAFGVATSILLAAIVKPEFKSWTPRLGWLALMFVVTTVVSTGVSRITNRAIPLSTLCLLNLEFPEAAPSRMKMALRVGNTARAERILKDFRSKASAKNPQDAAVQVIELIAMLNQHDRKTRGHSEKVRAFADVIAEQLRLDNEQRNLLRWGAMLHDIGKLTVAPSILNKPGKPTPEEWIEIKTHPAAAVERLEPLRPWLGDWVLAASEHHEKFDGTGYPLGLAGANISLAGRIVAVADAFEVMTATRSYKKPMSYVDAREELVRASGTHFDPEIVRAFLQVGKTRPNMGAGFLSSILHSMTQGSSITSAAQSAVRTIVGPLSSVAAPLIAVPALIVGSIFSPISLTASPKTVSSQKAPKQLALRDVAQKNKDTKTNQTTTTFAPAEIGNETTTTIESLTQPFSLGAPDPTTSPTSTIQAVSDQAADLTISLDPSTTTVSDTVVVANPAVVTTKPIRSSAPLSVGTTVPGTRNAPVRSTTSTTTTSTSTTSTSTTSTTTPEDTVPATTQLVSGPILSQPLEVSTSGPPVIQATLPPSTTSAPTSSSTSTALPTSTSSAPASSSTTTSTSTTTTTAAVTTTTTIAPQCPSPNQWAIAYYSPVGFTAGSYGSVETGTPLALACRGGTNIQPLALNSPRASVPNDFSLRAVSDADFTTGNALLNVSYDDGLIVYLDGVLLFRHWQGHYWNGLSSIPVVTTAGTHRITVEFFDSGSDAFASLDVSDGATLPGGPFTSLSPCATTDWKANWYDAPIYNAASAIYFPIDTSTLQDTSCQSGSNIVMLQPLGVSAQFGATLERNFTWSGGLLNVNVDAMIGARIYLDSIPILDNWTFNSGSHVASIMIPAGVHRVKIDFRNQSGTPALLTVTM
jgi:HD-GYP domain-containing protein (c-di-GMP phosphodiesterase class II)